MKVPITVWLDKKDIKKELVKQVKELGYGWNDCIVSIKAPGDVLMESYSNRIDVVKETPYTDGEQTLSEKDKVFIIEWSLVNYLYLLYKRGIQVDGLEQFDALLEPIKKPKTLFEKLKHKLGII